jgi:hypothetical protein
VLAEHERLMLVASGHAPSLIPAPLAPPPALRAAQPMPAGAPVKADADQSNAQKVALLSASY